MKCSCLLYVLASGFASLDGLPGGFRKQAPPWNTGATGEHRGNMRTWGKQGNTGGPVVFGSKNNWKHSCDWTWMNNFVFS